jgi:hypothetical protein
MLDLLQVFHHVLPPLVVHVVLKIHLVLQEDLVVEEVLKVVVLAILEVQEMIQQLLQIKELPVE